MQIEGSCPRTQRELIELEFIEHRTKILDIAAFLDRFDRSVEHNANDDFRIKAFREALKALNSHEFGRVERIQMLLSDMSSELRAERDGQSAYGAAKESEQ